MRKLGCRTGGGRASIWPPVVTVPNASFPMALSTRARHGQNPPPISSRIFRHRRSPEILTTIRITAGESSLTTTKSGSAWISTTRKRETGRGITILIARTCGPTWPPPPLCPTFQPNTTYMVSDVFSKSQGKHTWKFGGEFRYLQVNERNFANPNGGFTFDGTVTGTDFADFLLGATSTTSAPYTQAAEQFLDSRTRYGGAFAQDSWKVKSNLTLNLGLRWEASMPWYDTQGKIQTFNPGQQSTVFPLAPTGLVFPGDPGIPKTLAPTIDHNFGPRLRRAHSQGFSGGVLG